LIYILAWSFHERFFGVHVAVANGDEWKKQRKVMNPAFRIQMLKAFTDGFIEKVLTNRQTPHFVLTDILKDSSLFGHC